MKQLLLVSLTLAAGAGCATTTPAPLSPAPAIAPSENMALDTLVTPSDPTASATAVIDSLAADADALNKLAAATPDARAVPAFDPAGMSWDIDVVRYAAHPRVRYYLDYFQQQARKRMAIFLDRGAVFDSMIRSRFEREGLPGDLGYLALIESGYSSDAVSRANAVGMWQFMRATGRGYQLRVDTWVDERRDPVKATDAAARHLRDLRSRFGSLYLAAAAYNAGAGKVSRSLGKLEWEESAEGKGGGDDAAFFRLAETDLLAAETQDYVPKLIAAALIAKQPERYGFTPVRAASFAYDSIVVNDVTGLDVIARLAGAPVATIRQLNPQYLRLVTPPRAEAVVRLPPGTGVAVAKGYDKLSRAERVRFMTHVVRRKERWATLSKRYHLPAAELRAANPKLGAKVKTGTRVVIPAAAVPSALAIRATGTPLADREPPRQPAKEVRVASGRSASRDVATRHTPTHRVRRGETLTGLARRYRVTVRALARANTISPSYELKTGMHLRIPS